MTRTLRAVGLAVTAVLPAAAADLEWKYEGASPAPVVSSAVSAEPAAVGSSSSSAASAAYGTSGTPYFYTFVNSFDSDVQWTEFLSTAPCGMMLILR